jgi:diguanylate cyclase (GGDEF)-like protein/PAS domain S-box-containing protein
MGTFDDPDMYQGILEGLSIGLCVLDLQKRIVLWSDGAEKITGRRRHEVIGQSCIGEALLHCDHQDCESCHEECLLAQAMKTSQPIEGLAFVRHKRGHEIPVRVRATPVRNVHGSSGHSSILGAVATFEEQQATLSADPRGQSGNRPGCVDEITGVASRVMTQAHLREALATFIEMKIPLAILRLRLDGLDQFRGRFGPDAASCLLRLVARTLESTVWVSDFVGKWNLDEFLVILNGCRGDALQSVRERVRRMLAGDAIEWWGERHSLPVSIGQVSAETGDTLESLMQRLDQSLSAASGNRAAPIAPGTEDAPES